MYEVDLMKTVYSYYYPEVQEFLGKLNISPKIYKVNTKAKVFQRTLDEEIFGDFTMPQTEQGFIDVDAMSAEVLHRMVMMYGAYIEGLSALKYRYTCPGSSDAIFKILAHLKHQHKVDVIYTLQGEYEGYGEYAKMMGMRHIQLPMGGLHDIPFTGYGNKANSVFFISDPSARNGNYHTATFMNSLMNVGIKVVVDFTYFGAAMPLTSHVDHKNIYAALFSMSKSFGMFRRRVGWAACRENVPTLFANKWFKDPIRELEMVAVVKRFGFKFLTKIYKPKQEGIVKEINAKRGMSLKPSNVLLLAHVPNYDILNESEKKQLAYYRRGPGVRVCLTPYLELRERF